MNNEMNGNILKIDDDMALEKVIEGNRTIKRLRTKRR
jgi:hypothetical protein